MKYLTMAVLALYASHLFAGDASSCIQLGSTESSQTMKNICRETVVVFWCHNLDTKKTDNSLCGKDNRYFHASTMLKENEVTPTNPYNLPLGATIDFGACYGDYGSYKYTDKVGGYACKAPKIVSDDTVIMTTTASGPTETEACNQAKVIAEKNNTIGECSCQNRGSRFICKVQSEAAKPDVSIVNKAKDALRESIKCDPAKDKDCKPLKSKLVNPGGTRG